MSTPKIRELIEKRAVSEDLLEKAAHGDLGLPPAETLEFLIHLSHDAKFGAEAKHTLHNWGVDSIVAAIADPSASKEALQWAVGPENPKFGQTIFGLAKRSGDAKSVEKLVSVCPGPAIAGILTLKDVRSSEPLLQKLLANPNLKPEHAELVKISLEQLHGGAKPTTPESSKPEALKSEAAKEAAKPEATASASPSSPVTPEVKEAAKEADKSVEPASPPKTEAEKAAAAVEAHPHETGAHKEVVHAKKPGPGEPSELEVETQSNEWLQQHAAEIAAEAGTESALLNSLKAESESGDQKPVDMESLEDAVQKGVLSKERLSTVQKLLRMPVSLRIQQALKGTREERAILIHDTSRLVCLAVLASPKLALTEAETFASLKGIREEVLRELVRNRKFRKNYVVVKNLCNNPKNPLENTLALLNDLQPYDLRAVAMNKNVPDTIRKIAMKKFQDKVSGRRS